MSASRQLGRSYYFTFAGTVLENPDKEIAA